MRTAPRNDIPSISFFLKPVRHPPFKGMFSGLFHALKRNHTKQDSDHDRNQHLAPMPPVYGTPQLLHGLIARLGI